MAMTEEELARMNAQLEQTTEAFARLTGTLIGQSDEQLRATKADKDAKEAAAKFALKMDMAADAAKAVAGTFINYNKEVYKSGNANKAASAAIDSMGEAAKYAGAFLALLVPGGPLVKGMVAGLGLLTSELVKSSKLIADQTDEIYKAYQDMARAGAAGAGGMQDVFDSLQRVGMGTEKFGAYLKLVNENANDLAVFGNTVNKGRKIFDNTMASMSTSQRVQMEQMGLDREAQAEVTMNYLKQQRLLTQGTKAQMDTSSAAVMRYIEETDTLTRITGLNRKEQEKLLDDAMRNESYNATMQEIRETQGEAGVRRVQEAAAMAQKAGPETFKQFQASLSGFVGSSNEAGQAFMATGGKIAEVTDALRSGQLKNTRETATAMNGLFKAYGETAQQFRGQAKMMNYGATFGSFYEAVKAGSISLEDLGKAFDEAEEERLKQLANPTTKKMAETANATVEQQLKLQRGVNMGMEAYISGLNSVSNANATALDVLGNAAMKAAEALGIIGGGKKVQQSAAVQKAVNATTETRTLAKPLEERVDMLNKQIDEDEKILKEGKRAGKSVAELAPLEEKILKAKEEQAKATEDLIAQEKLIKEAAFKEKEIRQKQVAKLGEMNRLQRTIDQEKDEIASLNEKKYKLEKALANSGKPGGTGLRMGDENARGLIKEYERDIAKKQQGLGSKTAELAELQKNFAPSGATSTSNDYLKKIAHIESGAEGANAKAKTSSASGLFQFTDATWAGAVKQMGKNYTPEDRFDPQKAKEVAAFFTEQNKNQLTKSMGPEFQASDTDLYMAHFLGAGGASNFLKAMKENPGRNAADIAGANAAAANPNIFFKGFKNYSETPVETLQKRTLAEVYDMMDQKLGRASQQIAQGKAHEDVLKLASGGIVPARPGGTRALIGEAGVSEAVIPLKDGAVPIAMPRDFIEGTNKFQSLMDQIKGGYRETSSTGSKSAEETENAKSPVGNSADAMLAALRQMNDELKAQGDANRLVFESMLRVQANSNDIQSKMLRYAQN